MAGGGRLLLQALSDRHRQTVRPLQGYGSASNVGRGNPFGGWAVDGDAAVLQHTVSAVDIIGPEAQLSDGGRPSRTPCVRGQLEVGAADGEGALSESRLQFQPGFPGSAVKELLQSLSAQIVTC